MNRHEIEVCIDCPWQLMERCRHPKGPHTVIPELAPPKACPIVSAGPITLAVVRPARVAQRLPEKLQVAALVGEKWHIVVEQMVGPLRRRNMACQTGQDIATWMPTKMKGEVPEKDRCRRTACKKLWPDVR